MGAVIAGICGATVATAVTGYAIAYIQPQPIIDILQARFRDQRVYFDLQDLTASDEGSVKALITEGELAAAEVKPICALTIDDSPTDDTDALLDVLREHAVRATFFIISDQIPGREAVLERAVREGHELQNHYTRDCFSIQDVMTDEQVFERNLLECEHAIQRFQHGEPSHTKWFRPGRALFNERMLSTLHKHDYLLALGNVFPFDANDWKSLNSNSPRLNAAYLRARTRPRFANACLSSRPGIG